jgi:hypothetical protein
MNTSILSALLMASLFAPAWRNDYSQAQREAAASKKPLVVVFGSGANGWSQVIRDRKPSDEVTKLLFSSYVCVYIDTDNAAGKRLAQNFELSGNVGLVISDRALTTQAFWHQGNLSHDNAVHYLQKYAQADVVTRGTETAAPRYSYYPSQSGIPFQGYQQVPTRTINSANC